MSSRGEWSFGSRINQPQVVFENNHLLGVYKPHGWLSQGDGSGRDDVFLWAKQWLKETHQKPGNVFLGLLHRLDRQVGGLILFGKTSKGAGRVSEQLRARKIQKYYFALVEGEIQGSGALSHYLGSEALPRVAVSDGPQEGMKKAELEYESLGSKEGKCLLRIRLITGRKHQIRAQFASRGTPIVGDKKYGAQSLFQADHIALVAHRLVFQHPTQATELDWSLPESIYKVGDL